MSYYDLPSWQQPARQSSWDTQQSTSRPATSSSSVMSRDENTAFALQFEEVERTIDNLLKSGKFFAGQHRRDMGMSSGRQFSDFDPRMAGPSRHHSLDFDPMRSHSASNLQNFYANARFQPRGADIEQVQQAQQAKRRMAAQRERELRNYHQEQQYNRSISSQGKSDRSVSPNAMNEEERRELIARQHRALYSGSSAGAVASGGSGTSAASHSGTAESAKLFEGSSTFVDDGQTPRPANAPVAGAGAGGRGPSPPSYGSFNVPEPGQSSTIDESGKGPSPKTSGPRSRANSGSSPASNAQNFTLFDPSAAPQQSSRTSTSSPGSSPPRSSKHVNPPAPIGTRPTHAVNPALNKRTTPPASSPLSFGLSGAERARAHQGLLHDGSVAPNETNSSQSERASSANSTPAAGVKENVSGSVNWGSGGGVWGKSNLGNVQASVWG